MSDLTPERLRDAAEVIVALSERLGGLSKNYYLRAFPCCAMRTNLSARS